MKRTAIALSVILIAAFILVKVSKGPGNEGSTSATGRDAVPNEEKAGIAGFWAVFEKAESVRQGGDTAGAIKLYRAALKKDSTHETSLFRLGNLLAENGQYVDAISTFNKLIAVNPMSARAHRQIGRLLSTPRPGNKLDLVAARTEFERTLELNKEESGPYYWLGRVLIGLGLEDEGRQKLVNATRINPKDIEAYDILAYSYLSNNDPATASEYYLKSLQAGSNIIGSDHLSGEGDRKESLRKSEPTTQQNIAAYYGLAISSFLRGGCIRSVPERFRAALPKHEDDPLRRGSVRPVGNESRTGAVWIDIDNDGREELALVGPNSTLTLLHNDRDGSFVDITDQVGLGGAGTGWSVQAVDYDSDGAPDLYITRSGWFCPGTSSMYQNIGGRFVDVTTEVGLAGRRWTSQASFTDFDQDGDPDLIEIGQDHLGESQLRIYAGSPAGFELHQSMNPGSGFPVDCQTGDFDNDSWPDLFMLNWKGTGRLYRNEDGRRFADVTVKSGISVDLASLSSLFVDVDNDGDLDLFVSAMSPYPASLRTVLGLDQTNQNHQPALFINQGRGKFLRAKNIDGLAGCFGTMRTAAIDFNADAYTDIYLANARLEPGWFEPDVVLINQRGKSFKAVQVDGPPLNTLTVAISNKSKDGKLRRFIGKGGFLPGDRAEGIIYTTP